MHACGHDMHVAWLAAASTLLAGAQRSLARNADRRLPARRGDRPGGAGDDRRRPARALPEARRRARPARDAVLGRHDRQPRRRDHLRRRQPADPPLRARRARLDAAGEHRPGRDGGGNRAAAADDRRPRDRAHRRGRAHRGRAAGGHEGERDPRRGDHQAERAHLRRGNAPSTCSRRSRGSRTPKPKPRARRSRRRSRPSTATTSSATTPRRHGASATPSPPASAPTASSRSRRSRPARTSAPTEPAGRRPRSSGPSAAPTPTPTDRPKQAGTLNELPTNHNPRFAPVIHPTLETGIQALVTAACAWLGTTATAKA